VRQKIVEAVPFERGPGRVAIDDLGRPPAVELALFIVRRQHQVAAGNLGPEPDGDLFTDDTEISALEHVLRCDGHGRETA
jgi:hypothetical protein